MKKLFAIIMAIIVIMAMVCAGIDSNKEVKIEEEPNPFENCESLSDWQWTETIETITVD